MAKPTDFVQGTLDLLILKTISLEPKHGWAIAKRIQQVSQEALQIQQGSLYPALHRLEQQAWIKAEWRPTETGRMAKFYSLTRSGRKQLERELANLDRLIEENISSGMPPEEARRAAQRMIGGIAQYKEECRDMRRVNFVEDLAQDVRYTIRSLAKSPGFTGVVVATLALAIGANSTIFTIVHGVLLRPLDYPKPDQLMYLTAESPAIGRTRSALSAPEYTEFRQMNQSFAAVGAYSTGGAAYTTGEVNLAAGDRPLRVRSISVDAHLLKALSIQPEQG